jgi:hypothetical protein
VIIPFSAWEPDAAGIDASLLATAKNVWPSKVGYIPIPSLSAISTSALPTKCIGMVFARTSAGGFLIFAGTATKLYKFQSNAWVDVTRASSAAIIRFRWTTTGALRNSAQNCWPPTSTTICKSSMWIRRDELLRLRRDAASGALCDGRR